jgi:hypothetical protein
MEVAANNHHTESRENYKALIAHYTRELNGLKAARGI